MKYIVLICVLKSALAQNSKSLRAESHDPLKAPQVVAYFPKGVWDGQDCSLATLRFLPEKCNAALTEDSTLGERLACNLVSQPGSIGMVPFGMYPTDLTLDTELRDITSEKMTPIFTDCALAQMINDGCWSFRSEVSAGTYSTAKYSTASEYATSISQSYGVEVSVSAGYGPVSVRSGVSTKNNKASASSSSRVTATSNRMWRNVVGTLGMSTCVRSPSLLSYLKADYLSRWNQIRSVTTKEKLLEDPLFISMMNEGFYVPTSFEFAVQYSAVAQSTYEVSSSSSSNDMNNALSAGIEVSIGAGPSAGVSSTMTQAISNSQSGKNVKSQSTGSDSRYGLCDFKEMLANSASNWSNVLRDCAQEAALNLESLDRASRVTLGGFTSIFTALETIGVTLGPQVLEAMNEYFAYCSCDQPTASHYESGNNRFRCFYGSGAAISMPASYCNENTVCSRSFWFKRSKPADLCK